MTQYTILFVYFTIAIAGWRILKHKFPPYHQKAGSGILFSFLQLGDNITTYKGLAIPGVFEASPLLATALTMDVSVPQALMLKVTIAFLLYGLVLALKREVVMQVVNLWYIVVVLGNSAILLYMSPGKTIVP